MVIKLVGIILFVSVLWIGYSLFRQIQQTFGRHGRGRERCPSCHHWISVPKQDFQCPKCGEKLGRGHDGRLLIRIN